MVVVGLVIWPSSKCWWISQQDFNIVTTCMDYHETSPPLHPMIPIAYTLLHPISLTLNPSHQQCLCVPCPNCDYICNMSRFSMSPNIMHHTQVVISLWGVDAFTSIISSSSFNLDMDCIIRYEQWFPFWFNMPQLVPLYSMCSSCRGLTCFAYPFNSVGHWSI